MNILFNLEFFFERISQSVLGWFFGIMPLFVFFNIIKPNFLKKNQIKQIKGYQPQYAKEFLRSVLIFCMYIIPTYIIIFIKGYTSNSANYANIKIIGYAHIALNLFLLFLLLDTLMYWTHFLQHKIKKLYKTHEYHHRSINVNPLTTFSSNFSDAAHQASLILICLLIIPFHPTVFILFCWGIIVHGGYIHCGYDFEFNSKTGRQKSFLSWHYSPRHHAIHHHKLNCNFGFYFTFWDKINKTERLAID